MDNFQLTGHIIITSTQLRKDYVSFAYCIHESVMYKVEIILFVYYIVNFRLTKRHAKSDSNYSIQIKMKNHHKRSLLFKKIEKDICSYSFEISIHTHPFAQTNVPAPKNLLLIHCIAVEFFASFVRVQLHRLLSQQIFL